MEARWVLEKNVEKMKDGGYELTEEKKGSGDQAVYLMKPNEKKLKEIRVAQEKAKRDQEKKEKQIQIDNLKKQIKGLEDQLDNLDEDKKKK